VILRGVAMKMACSIVFAVGMLFFLPTMAASDSEKAQNLATCLTGRYPTLCKRGMLSADEARIVDGAEHRENLKTCLAGRYSALCNRGKLTPNEAQQVLVAEKRENLKTCLTGRYKALCRKDLLSDAELKQVTSAELAENARTCLDGRYPSLCDKSQLTKEQFSQAEEAESRAAMNRQRFANRSYVPRARRFSASGCESGHWVDSVSDDGQIVKLEDQSIWQIDAGDAIDSALWLPTTDIVACGDKLINTEDNETVSATRIR